MSKSFLLAGTHGRLKLWFSAAMAAAGALLMLTPGCFAQGADKTAPYLNPAVPIQNESMTWYRR